MAIVPNKPPETAEENKMNRINAAIEKYEAIIASKLASGELSKEKHDALDKSNVFSFEEFFVLQEKKSLFFASGKMSLDEANTIYGLLGNSLDTINSKSLSVRIVMTKVLSEMMGIK